MLAAVVDHERLKRLEKKTGAMTDPRAALALLARDAAQFLQDEIGAGILVAAQQAAFELADQQRARLRRELAQELPQPFDRVGARHRRFRPH
jgi:hypothetical protein